MYPVHPSVGRGVRRRDARGAALECDGGADRPRRAGDAQPALRGALAVGPQVRVLEQLTPTLQTTRNGSRWLPLASNDSQRVNLLPDHHPQRFRVQGRVRRRGHEGEAGQTSGGGGR